jgi:ABC-2 type transport system permease protein/oleandomycin transport system permease protein
MADTRMAGQPAVRLAAAGELDRVSAARRLARWLAESWIIAERNLLIWRRSWVFMALTLIQPVMFFVLFRFVLGRAVHVSTPGGYTDYVFPGVVGQTCAVAAAGTALTLGRAMTFGTVDRYRSMDIARSAFLTGRLAADVVRMAVTLIVLVILGFALGLRLLAGWPAGLAMAGLGLLLGAAMCCLAAWIGIAIRSQEAVQTYGFLWIFPLTFVSSSFVPVGELPGWLQGFARNQPFTVAADAMRELILGGPAAADVGRAVAWSAGLLVVFAALATRAYNRRSA